MRWTKVRTERRFEGTGKNEKEKVDGPRGMSRASWHVSSGDLRMQALCRKHRGCFCAMDSKLGLPVSSVRADLAAWLLAGRGVTPFEHAEASRALKVRHGTRPR